MAKRLIWLVMLLAGQTCAIAGPGWVDATVSLGCTGVIVSRGERWSYGLSASHCASVGKRFVLTSRDGETHEGEWLAKDENTDLSLFRVKSSDSLGVAVVPVSVPSGVPVAYGGCKGRSPDRIYIRRVGVVSLTNLPAKRTEYRVVAGKFGSGCSGGPIFVAGQTIGVQTHGDKDNEEMYAASLKQVRGFLIKNQDKAESPLVRLDSDKDRTAAIKEILKRLASLEGNKQSSGPPGPMGPQGERGPMGMDADTTELLKRIRALEEWRANFKARIRVRVSPREK
jgi:hypothetical protein